MVPETLIIAGPSGVGKSTVVEALCDGTDFTKVQSITTRDKRNDDKSGRYEYINESKYVELKDRGDLLVWAEYRGAKYGVKRDSIEEVKENCIPILIITPESAVECIIQNEDVEEYRFISVFLDVADDELDRRLKERDNVDSISQDHYNQRENDREFGSSFIYTLKNDNVDDTVQAIKTIWKFRSRSGVLPREYIRRLSSCDELIKEASEEHISHASYDLRLGDEYYNDGEIKKLDDQSPFVTIEPYDYAIVMSKETVSFPRDVAGRFDLTVSLFCQGIILSNGPQVDPGFEGRLFCLLFNTSDARVPLKRGEKYATLEMRKLLAPTDPYEGKYQDKIHIADYLPEVKMRGAVNELKKEIDKIEEERERLQSVVFTRNITIALGFISFILAILAIVVALISSGTI